MSLSPKILDLLKSGPLLSGLSNAVLTQYLDRCSLLHLAAGQTLLTPGDANENIYVILSGRLRVNPDKSNDATLAMFGEGESVGEISVLNGNKALDYLIADTDCELLCIDLVTMWSLLNNSHRAALNMLNILSTPVSMSKRSNHSVEHQQGYAGLNQVDELTGLYNCQWIFKTFERQLRRLSITHDYAVLMMVSIDQFDLYNQTHGMLGGDQAFRAIAQSVLTCLRPEDHSGRYYGKVIAMYMSHTTLQEGLAAGNRLLSQSAKASIVTPSGDILPHITISIGITEVKEGDTMHLLFDQATAAMQRATEAGGNCIRN